MNFNDEKIGILAKKNRNRSDYSFANINLLGKCNVDCDFCLGKDLGKEFEKYQTTNIHFNDWTNFQKLIDKCKELKIPQIYLTGQNTDSLLYKYLDELIDYLKSKGFFVGLRTNGMLALNRMDQINKCTTCWGDAVSYSIHTLDSDTQFKIMKIKQVPDWDKIIKATTAPLRIAIVFNRYNKDQTLDVIKFCSNYSNVKYIQLRKICTDNRYEYHEQEMKDFEIFENEIKLKYKLLKSFESANIYEIHGMEVSFWRTVGTTVNSINYFTNGVLSDDYFVIEGYSIEKNIEIGNKDLVLKDYFVGKETK